MSYPILYDATETGFNHNGIGILSACVSCEVTEEANGSFELSMQYPMDGIHYEYISDRAIIKAKADQFRDPQLFRVYAISKPMNGIVTVLAEHISYDLSGIPVKPFSSPAVSSSLMGLKNNAVVDCPFDFWTDKSTQANFKVSAPASIRSRLGGVAGSILDVYGGEYEFDNFTVKLHNSRGQNRGVSIRYGKNLTDIKQDQNCSNVATGVYPYWAGTVEEKDVLVELPERIVNAPGTYNFVKIRTLDLSGEFETQPTVDQLRSRTQNYIKANNIGVPAVSLSVSFAQLDQTEEYKHLKLLERVSLFDTVNVEFPALKVSATAKAVKMVYDVLADRVKSVTLGSVRANIADTIANQQTELEKTKDKPSVSMVQKISSALAKAIMGANGGAVRLIDTNEDGEPDELYIADNADPAQAVKVWRFNYNGWAASKNGYSGPFEFGATLEDGLLANFVTAAQLVAGTIKSQDNGKTFFLDLDNGVLNMNASSLQISGSSVSDVAKDSVKVGGTNLFRNSEAIDTVSPWIGTNGTTVTAGEIDGKPCIVIDPSTSTQDRGRGVQTVSADGAEMYTLSAQVYVESARTVLLMFWRITSSGWVGAGWKSFDCKAGWNTVSATTDRLGGETRFVAGFESAKEGVFYVYHPKVEKGNIATAWSPSPDDLNDYADKASEAAVNRQTQTDIFNKLTNNGQLQGLYMKDGKLYINASYLKSGIINASLISAGVLESRDEKLSMNMEQGSFTIYIEQSDGTPWARYSFSKSFGFECAYYSPGKFGSGDYYPSLGFQPGTDDSAASISTGAGQDMFIGPSGQGYKMQIAYPFNPVSINSNDINIGDPSNPYSKIVINGKQVSWKDNGDGTYTLIGQ